MRQIIDRLCGRKPESAEKRPVSLDTSREFSVDFCDLSEPEKAQERGVRPGYYFTVQPVSQHDLNKGSYPQFASELTPYFFPILQDKGLLQTGGHGRIPIDTEGTFIDSAAGWRFSPAGYISEKQLLVIRAEPVSPDEAQKKVVGILGRK